MIPTLIAIVSGYVMFRCIEVFCKRSNGEYSDLGFVVLVFVAIALFLLTAFLAISTLLNPTPAAP